MCWRGFSTNNEETRQVNQKYCQYWKSTKLLHDHTIHLLIYLHACILRVSWCKKARYLLFALWSWNRRLLENGAKFTDWMWQNLKFNILFVNRLKVCLFGVFVPLENFSLVLEKSPLPVKGWILTYARHSWPLSSKGSLAYHTYCDIRLLWSTPRTRDTHTYCRAFSSGAVTKKAEIH